MSVIYVGVLYAILCLNCLFTSVDAAIDPLRPPMTWENAEKSALALVQLMSKIKTTPLRQDSDAVSMRSVSTRPRAKSILKKSAPNDETLPYAEWTAKDLGALRRLWGMYVPIDVVGCFIQFRCHKRADLRIDHGALESLCFVGSGPYLFRLLHQTGKKIGWICGNVFIKHITLLEIVDPFYSDGIPFICRQNDSMQRACACFGADIREIIDQFRSLFGTFTQIHEDSTWLNQFIERSKKAYILAQANNVPVDKDAERLLDYLVALRDWCAQGRANQLNRILKPEHWVLNTRNSTLSSRAK